MQPRHLEAQRRGRERGTSSTRWTWRRSSAARTSSGPGRPGDDTGLPPPSLAPHAPLPAACAERLPRAEWTRQPSPGLFSLVEHCCHLRDLEEEGYTLRLRRMLREDGPVAGGLRWRRGGRRRSVPGPGPGRRGAGVHRGPEPEPRWCCSALDARGLARTATFGEHGTITVARLAELMAEHDAGHHAELEALFATLGVPVPE